MLYGLYQTGRTLPWSLRALRWLCWVSLATSVASVLAILVLAAGHDALDPSGRWAWTTAAVLAGAMVVHTVAWTGSIVGGQAWRRRWYRALLRRTAERPAVEGREVDDDPVDAVGYTGWKIAYVAAPTAGTDGPASGAVVGFCFRPLNQRASTYGVEATSWCAQEGSGGVLCPSSSQHDHRCGFHAVRLVELIGPDSPAQVEWDWERRRRRSQVLLEVGLSGWVEPGEWGYRATEQQVLRVGFQRACIGCRRRRAAEYLAVRRCDGHELVVPVCARHRRAPSFTPLELANRLGTEVGWIDAAP